MVRIKLEPDITRLFLETKRAQMSSMPMKEFSRIVILSGLQHFRKKKALEDIYPTLSRREKEVLPLVLLRKSLKEMAEELFIATSTLKVHIRNIAKKSGLKQTGKGAVLEFWQGWTE